MFDFSKFKFWIKRNFFLFNLLVEFKRSINKGKIRLLFHWFKAGHLIKKVRVNKWLSQNYINFLQIGGGYYLKSGKEWLNGDIIAGEIYLNAKKGLPFPSNSIDLIFTEHFFEHINQKQGTFFLAEAYRVLKPGGILRQSTPDLKKITDVYMDQNDLVSLQDAVDRHIRSHRKNSPHAIANGCQFVNDLFRLWGHQFIYDKDTLKAITKRAGFTQIKCVSFGKSEHDNLNNLERHAGVEWMKNGLNIILEAKK